MAKKPHQAVEFKPVLASGLAPAEPAGTQPFLPAQAKTWTIGLSHLPDMQIEASSQGEAIAIYNATLGIRSTEHTYRVS